MSTSALRRGFDPPDSTPACTPLDRKGQHMNANTVFVKTAKGREEIDSRTYRLPFSNRTVLIMVDGAKDAEALSGIRPDALEILEHLLAGGFIDTAGAAGPGRLMPVSTPPGKAIESKPAPVAFDLGTARKLAGRGIRANLGPAGETLAIAIEDAKTPGEFVQAATRAREAIRIRHGAARAGQFWTAVGL
jgi:hypothetical protein